MAAPFVCATCAASEEAQEAPVPRHARFIAAHYTWSSLLSSLLACPPPTAISPHPGPRRQMARLKAER